MTTGDAGDDAERTGTAPGGSDPDPAGEDGDARREWLLVAAVVVATLVVPGLIYLRPPALPFRLAFLVLPLIPAVLLGAVAVYVAVESRRA